MSGSPYDFSKNGRDYKCFGDLFLFAKECGEMSVLTPYDYAVTLTERAWEFAKKHEDAGSPFFPLFYDVADILASIPRRAIAVEVDDQSPWDDDETGEMTINEKLREEMTANSMDGKQVEL